MTSKTFPYHYQQNKVPTLYDNPLPNYGAFKTTVAQKLIISELRALEIFDQRVKDFKILQFQPISPEPKPNTK